MAINSIYKNVKNTKDVTNMKSAKSEDKSVVWQRIQHLSNELIETAEAGDWTALLRLENEWLKNIKQFVETHREQVKQPQAGTLSVAHLESLLGINDDLYQQCQQSRANAANQIDAIRQRHTPTTTVVAQDVAPSTAPRMR